MYVHVYMPVWRRQSKCIAAGEATVQVVVILPCYTWKQHDKTASVSDTDV